eukprot:4229482-Pleurochrysis_carterae.AAC.1
MRSVTIKQKAKSQEGRLPPFVRVHASVRAHARACASAAAHQRGSRRVCLRSLRLRLLRARARG